VAAFLTRAGWAPVATQPDASQIEVVPPAAAWHVGEGEEGPRYAPFLLEPLRRALDWAPRALKRLRSCGRADGKLAVRLLEAVGQATVQVDDTVAPAVASLLRKRFGDRIREASTVEVAIELDGIPFAPISRRAGSTGSRLTRSAVARSTCASVKWSTRRISW